MNIEIIKSIFLNEEFWLPFFIGLVVAFFYSKIAPQKQSIIWICIAGATLWGGALQYCRARYGIELSWVFTPHLKNIGFADEGYITLVNNSSGMIFSGIAVIITALLASFNPSRILPRFILFLLCFVPGQVAFIVINNMITYEYQNILSKLSIYIIFWMAFFALVMLPKVASSEEE